MIRGQKRALDKRPSVNVNLNASIHNRFDIEVVDAKTGEVKQKAQAENVICSQLWTRMLNSSASVREWFTYLHYGSGDGTPDVTDTSLFSFLSSVKLSASKNEPDWVFNCEPNTGVFSARARLVLGSSDAVGATITEVGIGYSESSSSLCTHAMLADMNGNKISITKTDTDIINIYATVFLHFNPNGYQNGDVRILNESPYNSLIAKLIMGFAQVSFGSSDFAYFPTYGHFGSSFTKNKTNSSYYVKATPSFDTQNKCIKISFARTDASKNNVDGGYGGLTIKDALSVRAGGISIPATRVIGEAVGTGDGVTTEFLTKFSFAHDAIVYVDGVQTQEVSVDCRPKCNTQMGRYFVSIDEHGNLSNNFYCPDGGLSIGPLYELFFENPYNEFGIASANTGNYGYSKIYGSNDLKEWTLIRENGNGPILEGHEYDRYFKFVSTHSSSTIDGPRNFVAKDLTEYNIHFQTPPADGAVITIDYTSDTAAKDENHVFDFSLTIQLGEYTE